MPRILILCLLPVFVNVTRAQSGIDLAAGPIEVTQTIQDLKNSVRLVANKRTFVRFHATAPGGSARASAVLRVTANNKEVVLSPVNPGGEIEVLPTPDRGVRDQAFLFELPDGSRSGSVSLRAEVNPAVEGRRNPEETNVDNNVTTATVNFEAVPKFSLVIYNLGYSQEGQTFYAPDTHLHQMLRWIQKAWPVSDIHYSLRREFHNGGVPNCEQVNTFLASKRTWDLQSPASGINESTRYYGMVSSGGEFMRGCADDLPGMVSSGPTGVPGNDDSMFGRWIPDISWGGLYGGHEVAHNMGRYHAEFCDAKAGKPFPFPQGGISPADAGADAVYGFDAEFGTVLGPDWRDNLTYCAKQWNSPFTYHGILDAIQQDLRPRKTFQDLQAETPQDRFLIVGTIYVDENRAELYPLFVIPGSHEVKTHSEGNYTIVLRGAGNRELLRWRFTPEVMDEESAPVPPGMITEHVTAEHALEVDELVPFVAGVTRVDLENPQGSILTSLSAGVNPPAVSITAPRAGTVLSGDSTILNWTASDPDGDRLTFDVQYSRDNGVTWEIVDEFITDRSLNIDTLNLQVSERAQFRVWASDGLHSTGATVSVVVPNRPPDVKILSPAGGEVITAGQPLHFQSEVYDVDSGNLEPSQMRWASSLEGVLGTGESVTAASLRVGLHTITLTADDGSGGITSATVPVLVRPAGSRASNTTRIAQVAGGGGLTTTLTLRNPSSTASTGGFILFFGADGKPLGTIVKDSVVPFLLTPSGTFTFSTNPQTASTPGYATLLSYDPIAASVSYSGPSLGVASGDASAAGAFGFRAAVERNRSAGRDAGISVVNVGNTFVHLVLSLVDSDGQVLNLQKSFEMAPGQQVNRQFSELFPELPNFRGTLRIGNLADTALPGRILTATVLQYGGGRLSVVPLDVLTKGEQGN